MSDISNIGASKGLEESYPIRSDEKTTKAKYDSYLDKAAILTDKLQYGLNKGYISVGKNGDLQSKDPSAVKELLEDMGKLGKSLSSEFPGISSEKKEKLASIMQDLFVTKDNFKDKLNEASRLLQQITGKTLDAKAYDPIGWNDWKNAIKPMPSGPVGTSSATYTPKTVKTESTKETETNSADNAKKEIVGAIKNLQETVEKALTDYKPRDSSAVRDSAEFSKKISDQAESVLNLLEKFGKTDDGTIKTLKDKASQIKEEFSKKLEFSPGFPPTFENDIPSAAINILSFLKNAESSSKILNAAGTMLNETMLSGKENTPIETIKNAANDLQKTIKDAQTNFKNNGVDALVNPDVSTKIRDQAKAMVNLLETHGTDSSQIIMNLKGHANNILKSFSALENSPGFPPKFDPEAPNAYIQIQNFLSYVDNSSTTLLTQSNLLKDSMIKEPPAT